MMNSALRKNIIDISFHLAVVIICCTAIYLKTGNVSYISIFIMGAIFIDLDHLVDHFLYFKNKFNLNAFFSSGSMESGKVYIFLHSWELTLLLYIAGLAAKSTGLVMLSAGFAAHLAADSLMKKNFVIYFLAYRIANKFDVNLFL